MISDSIRKQSIQIFRNIDILFNTVSEIEFHEIIGGFKIWKSFYHLIHSIDKNFIDPSNFVEPKIHNKNMDIIYLDTIPELTKSEILNYYNDVRNKIEKYLYDLNDNNLKETIKHKDKELTRLELYIAQIRHIFFHIGYLHCCLKIKNGQTPEYIGLYNATPE